ncbi:MAG TPA: type II toxin-antitoxin system RelE/ParE family toxin [Blastocatellia bacterium]|nr:type II toxin-antitoxin system RelE/ParE family toxin [Blastocatellia bacterium]
MIRICREVFEGPYRIVYRIKTDQIDVVAVIHGSRKWPTRKGA